MIQPAAKFQHAYAIYSDERSTGPRKHHSANNLVQELANLRTARNYVFNPWASLPMESDLLAPTSDAYPYANRMGPLRSDPSNHWGYKFWWGGKAVSVWIEKQVPGTTLKEDLEAPDMAAVVQTNSIGKDGLVYVGGGR